MNAKGFIITRVKAIRIMTASKFNAHTEPLFKQLNIMKIEKSYELQCLKFYYKFKTNTLPAFFDNIFTRNSDIHPYSTKERDQLHFFPLLENGCQQMPETFHTKLNK